MGTLELKKSPKFQCLIKLLEKYEYLNVMITGYFIRQDDAYIYSVMFANYLYENNIAKSRLRANGFIYYGKAGFEIRIYLVPSKEMIDKAVAGKL